HYRQALVLAGELDMRPLIAHCHLGLGQWYRRAGDPAKAHEHMAVARTLYRELDVTLWLAQVEAEQPVTA
ncbi:MAG TPA: hypothetical protein VL915_11575, partial [Gemmatimonadales bacterium]|nr:hypothetical protein [Gemmatimonadales bacterium]